MVLMHNLYFRLKKVSIFNEVSSGFQGNGVSFGNGGCVKCLSHHDTPECVCAGSYYPRRNVPHGDF